MIRSVVNATAKLNQLSPKIRAAASIASHELALALRGLGAVPPNEENRGDRMSSNLGESNMQNLEMALQRAKPGTGAAIDFSGDWKNQLGSTMQLKQQGNTLEGNYVSTVSGTHATTEGELKGFVDGDLISVVVHWKDFQAITAWAGQCTPNSSNNTIKTLWQMTKQVDSGDEWASINAGSDTFTRT
jgi:hypothetical protein